MPATTEAPPDTLLVHRALGSEACYRVLRARGDLVEVEVVDSPGLLRGTPLRFTATAVRAMERVDPDRFTAGAPSPVRLAERGLRAATR